MQSIRMVQRAAIARGAAFGAAFIASGRRRVPRAQGRVTCTSVEAAMIDFIQRRSFFMVCLRRFWRRGLDDLGVTIALHCGKVLTIRAEKLGKSCNAAGQLWQDCERLSLLGFLGFVEKVETIAKDRFQVCGVAAAILPPTCPDYSRITEICRP